MSGFEIPIRALRQQIASALQVVIQTARLTGGRRKIVSVSEITGMEGDQIQMHDLFVYEQTGVDGAGNATGHFMSTGLRPRCADRIEHHGLRLPPELFMRRVLQ
jgi:pilus assembly protein CpaF